MRWAWSALVLTLFLLLSACVPVLNTVLGGPAVIAITATPEGFVAVGSGIILTSADGRVWRRVASPNSVLQGVRYFREKDLVVAVGDRRTFWVSADRGKTWRGLPGSEADLNDVAYGDGHVVAVGTVDTSNPWRTGGAPSLYVVMREWPAQRLEIYAIPQPGLVDIYLPLGVTYGRGRFLAVGSGARTVSFNVTEFGAFGQKRPVPTGLGGDLFRVLYAQEQFVAVGSGGTIAVSGDGTTWERVASPVRATLMGLAYDEGLWAAVGEGGTVLLSPDGREWRKVEVGTGTILRGVAVRGDTVVVGGMQTTLRVSQDRGRTWEAARVE